MTMTDTARRVTVKIPMSPPSELSPNARRRGNVWAQRSATKDFRDTAWAAVVALKPAHEWTFCEPFGGWRMITIHEHIIWPKSKGVLPDPDALPTYCKAALDGIVDAGLIAGDSHKHIASVTTSQEKGTDPLGWTIITIEEAA